MFAELDCGKYKNPQQSILKMMLIAAFNVTKDSSSAPAARTGHIQHVQTDIGVV
jgi:hypothetical protein